MKTIGLLAAFGPVAGAHFYMRLLQLVDAKSDADYPGIVLLSRPDIPDRMQFLLHDGPSPVPWFTEMARQLDTLNVDLVAIASATSHVFLPEVEKACRARAVSLLAAVGAEVTRQGSRRLGLLATSASVRLHLYEPYLPPGQRAGDAALHHASRTRSHHLCIQARRARRHAGARNPGLDEPTLG